MCGINGYIDKAGGCDLSKTLQTMNGLITHRGPDDSGVWIEGSVGMGMQRLSIIDLESGQQPMHNPTNQTTIVFNGEIYNYQSLKAELQKEGCHFETNSDTEVILKLYELHGEQSFGRLDGMFAFSLLDSSRDTVFCARDFFGEKPLYYFSDTDAIAWASELKSLMAVRTQKPPIDSKALGLYFRLTYIPAPFTIYEGIHKLAPNQGLAINTKDHSIQVFEIEQEKTNQTVSSKKEAIRHTHDLVKESVKSRTVSDVPLASFLSGGVDSSIVSWCLSELQDTPIDTFSIGFDNPLFDESKNAKTVAKTIGSKHHSFVCTDKDIHSISEEILLNFDEPYADSSALASYWVAHHTSKQFKVALTGDGGDEVFGGYNKYLIGQLSHRYQQWVPKPLHWFNRFFFNRFLSSKSDRRGFQYKAKKFLNAIDEKDNTYLNIISLGVFSKEYDQLFQPQWKQKEVFVPYSDKLPKQPSQLNDFKQIDRLLSLDGDLLTKVDRTSMKNSLECRAPFLNKTLWDFTQALPEDWLIHKWDKKHLLKEAFAPYFPERFFEQPKKGFNVPVGDWLRTVYKKQLLQFADAKTLQQQGIFQTSTIQAWIQAHLSNKQDRSFQLWTFFCFQLWYYNTFCRQ
jgi:asparagine synthase (glutamine-hydrolysing)